MSIEAAGPFAQHQNWSYFLDAPRRESGSDEFVGQGMLVAEDETVVHFRKGAPGVRLSGERRGMR